MHSFFGGSWRESINWEWGADESCSTDTLKCGQRKRIMNAWEKWNECDTKLEIRTRSNMINEGNTNISIVHISQELSPYTHPYTRTDSSTSTFTYWHRYLIQILVPPVNNSSLHSHPLSAQSFIQLYYMNPPVPQWIHIART